jgi:hypothetical protein
MKLLFSLFFISLTFTTIAQQTSVKGRVASSLSNESIEMASVTIVELQKIVFTDKDGVFSFENVVPGLYTFKAKAAGFDEQVLNEISVTYTRTIELNFTLEPLYKQQQEVKVKASPFKKNPESPVSLRTLNAAEIERLPGAGRDVSKVLQALPGVALRPTFRNDIIIRGGAPSENKFYLDGIEVPNINHFATQGSSGGPVGLLNVNFIREVDFYSGAFPANRANGLSSVISFNQKDGNKEKLVTNFALGSSDAALTFDGPLGKKADFIFSIRRSYLQFLFSALKLPFLPTYNDSQFKVNFRPNDKNKISIIGLGAYDDFTLNTSVNDGITDTTKLEYNNFILGNIPTQKQWNYTIGMNWQHFSKNSIQTVVASRNMLNNSSARYFNNIETPINRILDYSSFEAENKFRFEHQFTKNGYKFNLGVAYEYARYFSSNYNKIAIQGNVITIDNQSNLYMSKASAFGQVSKAYLDGRMNLSLGLRTDINSYSSAMQNPLNQLSPMLSASYKLTPSWTINANVARFNQLPAYTILGYRNATGDLVNKQNDLKYITADHFVLGTAYLTEFNARFSVEGFYKKYTNYPFSINDSISLANLGTEFGIVGNEAVRSVSTGRAYGTEFLYQQKMVKGFYGVVAYTFVTSEFLTANNTYAASSWDSKNIVSLTGGKRFKNGWEVGVRWLYSGGSPYTPIDVATSSLKAVWDVNGRGLLDYSKLNTEREGSFHQLNIRVDKKYYLKKWTLNFYLDIQNAYAAKTKVAPILLVEKDAAGNPITDPNDPTRYKTKFIENTSGILQPSIGIIIEFKQ